MTKQWVNSIQQLREAYSQVAEDMKVDQKPRSIEIKIPVNKRSAEHNALFHVVIRQIRKHLFKSGLGVVEYEDEQTGRRVRMSLDDEVVKALVKQKLGTQFKIMDVQISKPTRQYSPTEMYRVLKQIDAWCATDLNLQIVYKDRMESIEEKYRGES